MRQFARRGQDGNAGYCYIIRLRGMATRLEELSPYRNTFATSAAMASLASVEKQGCSNVVPLEQADAAATIVAGKDLRFCPTEATHIR